MRFKLALLPFALVVTPALAHPEHGFQLPDLLHVVTEGDHLAVAAAAIVLLAIVGGFAFRRSRK